MTLILNDEIRTFAISGSYRTVDVVQPTSTTFLGSADDATLDAQRIESGLLELRTTPIDSYRTIDDFLRELAEEW